MSHHRRELAVALALAALALALAGCGGDSAVPDAAGSTDASTAPDAPPTPIEATPIVDTCVPAPPRPTEVHEGVVYAAPGGAPLAMDVVIPTDAGLHPILVLIHGGGWAQGSRAELLDMARWFGGLGYVAATIDYRLTTATMNVFPAALLDVRCAIRTLRAGAATLGADPTRVGALGASAGGHLAALVATTAAAAPAGGDECPVRDGSVAVAAVVSYAGPDDLRDLALLGAGAPEGIDVAGLVRSFLGGDPADVPATATAASPIAHVTAATPPFFFAHGAADPVVPLAQSARMRDALWSAHVPATLFAAPGAGHTVGWTPALSTTALCTSAAFFADVLAP